MKIEEKFRFGKYEGLRLVDVYRGTMNLNRQLLKDYVNHLLNTKIRFHFENNFGSAAFECVDEFAVTENEITTLTFCETGINKDGVPFGELFEMTNDLENDLEFCLSIGNQQAGYGIGGFCSLEEFSKSYTDRLIVGADPEYLSWCIKKIEGFSINIDDIEKLEKLKIAIFHGFRVMRKDGGNYEYSPNIELKYYQLPESIKHLNQSKNEKLNIEFDKNQSDEWENGPGIYGYSSWEEMSFYEAYEGDYDAWAHDNQ